MVLTKSNITEAFAIQTANLGYNDGTKSLTYPASAMSSVHLDASQFLRNVLSARKEYQIYGVLMKGGSRDRDKPASPQDYAEQLFVSGADFSVGNELASTWNQISRSSPQQDPFSCSSDWQLCFHEAFEPGRSVLINRADDSLIHFAKYRLGGVRPVLAPIETMWMFGCNALGPHALDLLDDLIPKLPAYYPEQLPAFIVSGLEPEGCLYRDLRRRYDSRFDIRKYRSKILCAASLEGGLDGFLSRRSANHRKKLRQNSRRAKEQGILFERVIPTSEEQAFMIYRRMLAVERVSWKGYLLRGMDQPGPCDFYGALIRRLSVSHEARVIFATHAGEDIGFIFGVMVGGIYRGQQFSYDDVWGSLSIGNLLQFEKIRWACEEGAHRYDMGPRYGDRMEYKQHWTEKQVPIEALIMERQ
jgi:hypothetical protein